MVVSALKGLKGGLDAKHLRGYQSRGEGTPSV